MRTLCSRSTRQSSPHGSIRRRARARDGGSRCRWIRRDSTSSIWRPGRVSSMRRRRRWLPLSLSALALALPAPASAAPPLHRLVGGVVMSALASAPKPSFLAHIRDGDMGGVIFTQHWSSAAQMNAVSREVKAAACAGGSPFLVAVDQEGGAMRRLPWAEPAASARELGADERGPRRDAKGAPQRQRCAARVSTSTSPRLPTRSSRPGAFSATARSRAIPTSSRAEPLRSRKGSSRAASPRRRSTSPASAPRRETTRRSRRERASRAAAAVPQRDRRRREARDGVERVVSAARPVRRAGGLLARDRHGSPARSARIRRRRRDGRTRCADACRDPHAPARAIARGCRPAALHLGVGRATGLREPARGCAGEPACSARRSRPPLRASRR